MTFLNRLLHRKEMEGSPAVPAQQTEARVGSAGLEAHPSGPPDQPSLPEAEAEAAGPAAEDRQPPSTPTQAYNEADNRGTRLVTWGEAYAYWQARTSVKGDRPPFVLYTFPARRAAYHALLELPYIELAGDTANLVCTKPLDFGYYLVPDGAAALGYPEGTEVFEALVAGFDLTHEEWEEARRVFAAQGGRLKNEQEPWAEQPTTTSVADASKVRFIREDRQVGRLGNTNIYRVHEAPGAASAEEFLSRNPVTEQFLYLVVETPEGTYCRDIQGMYRES